MFTTLSGFQECIMESVYRKGAERVMVPSEVKRGAFNL